MNNNAPVPPPPIPSAPLAVITQAITASLDVSHIFSIVAQEAGHVLAYDALVVLLLPTEDDAAATQRLVVAFCHPPLVEAGQSWPLPDCSFGPALLAGQPNVVADFAATAAQYAGDRAILDTLGHAAVVVPIRAALDVLGGIAFISRTPHAYRPDDALRVAPIAGLLALALEHQRLDQQASALAVVEERNRLARDIHDTLAQSLTGIIINLESLKPYATSRSGAAADVLTETELLARGALEEARRSVLDLHPTPLQHQSLRIALAAELAGLARRAGLATQFYVQGTERALPPDVATALFRVAQEALQNIYKHAAARHVILGLAFEADAAVLTIEDDGVGFTPAAPVPDVSGGFGLVSMAARARSLGGEFLLTSHRGHGTAVRAALPTVRAQVATAAVVLPDALPPDSPAEGTPTRVLVVDDHALVRQGIRHLLEEQSDMQVVGEAADGLTAVEQTRHLRPDVVLLDLQMPRLGGIAALPLLRAAHPAVEVIILTTFDQDEQIFASLQAGARGYVLKDAAPATIVAAVRAARQGQSSLPPPVTTRLVDRFVVLAQRAVNPDALTARELEILDSMAQGTPYKTIAAQLSITTSTVQYHVTNILRKLQVGNRGAAVAVARQQGLLQQVE